MIRLGLSGTNWTRKTTTIDRLVEALQPQAVDVIALRNLVAQCPYPMGSKQTLDGSRWMTHHVREILKSPESTAAFQIFDRTPLDIFAFTLHAANAQGNDGATEITELLDEIRELGSQFRGIFLCRPATDWPTPETPGPTQLEFARQMDLYLADAAKQWPGTVRELPWLQNERLDYIRRFLANGKDARDNAV